MNHHKHHSLFNWLSQMKLGHEKIPNEHSEETLGRNNERQSTVADGDPPVGHGSGDFSNPSEEAKNSPASTPSKKPKDSNLIHFHRPHGLLFQGSSAAQPQMNQRQDSGTAASITPSEANSQQDSGTCCLTPSQISTNDADDEYENETDDDEQESIRSRDGTKQPPCTRIMEAHSRENSVFSLPEDVDGPNIGFKKLEKDGDLVDWDELSTFMEGQYDDCSVYGNHSTRMLSRSVIRNDLVRLALNGPFRSPINTTESKKHVLHIGCGDGSWCTDTAQLFPHWLFIGLDDKTGGPSPDQRKVPKNFKYIRCFYDILKTIKDVPSDSFDLVYTRFLIDAYGDDDYKDLIKECHRICKPGGYVELYELDMRIYGNPKVGPITHKVNTKVFRVMEVNNLNPRLARKLGDMVSDVFQDHNQELLDTDSKQTRLKKRHHFDANYTSLPLGLWGGRLGVLFRDNINDLFMDSGLHDDIDSDASYDGSVSSLSDSIPYDKDIETMDGEFDQKKSFMNLHYVYARKCK